MKRFFEIALLVLLALSAGTALAQTVIVQPPRPSDLHAQLQDEGLSTNVRLTWSAPTGPWLFRVYRSVDGVNSFHPLNVTNMLKFEDYLVLPGHKYFYYVTSQYAKDSALLESKPSTMDSVSLKPAADRPRGVIAGTITDSLTGNPIPFVKVRFYRFFPMMMRPTIGIVPVLPEVWTDALGQYKAALDTGLYMINAAPWLATTSMLHYVPEWYKDARTPEKATPVPLAHNAVVTVNMDLERVMPPATAWLSGTVRESSGTPLKNAIVFVVRSVQTMQEAVAMGSPTADDIDGVDIDECGFVRGVIWWGLTDSLGAYKVRLPEGIPYVVGAVKKFYLPQFFSMKASPDEADAITLSGDTTGIDFSLSLLPVMKASVSGAVRDSTFTGVQSRVMLIPVRPQAVPLVVRFTNTDSAGAYAFTNVHIGKYFALAMPFDNFAPAFYKAGAFGVISWKKADTIIVSGDVSGITIGVVPVRPTGFVKVHGMLKTPHLLAKDDAYPAVPGANMFLLDAQGGVAGFATTDMHGSFVIPSVESGSYTLVADKAGYSAPSTPVQVGGSTFDVTTSDITMTADGTTGVQAASGVPQNYELSQNYPNPFNPSTVIRYALPAAGNVSLKVFNLLGQEVATLASGYQAAGTYSTVLDAQLLSSGVYFYRLEAGSFHDTRRMLLLK